MSHRWVDDPDVDISIPCACGAPMEALKVEPPRSWSYLNHIWLCTRDGCKAIKARVTARKESDIAA